MWDLIVSVPDHCLSFYFEEVKNDPVSLIAGNENKIVKLQQVAGGEAPMTTNLDMGGCRILNIAQPRDPRKYESDLVTAKLFMIIWP